MGKLKATMGCYEVELITKMKGAMGVINGFGKSV